MRPVPAAPHAPAYRPDIDGMRALAIAAAMLYHAHWGAPGGYVGVDVFFVISGFLIGSQLLGELRTGRIDLVAFWERRARRILPALVLMLLGTAVASAFFLLPADFASFGSSLAAQTVFTSNHYFAANAGYFGTETVTKPLLHTWSLAVEEQFYLLFPLVLLLLAKLPRRIAVSAFVALCGASLLYSAYVARHDPRAAYYFMASRAWELGLGVVVAACPPFKLGPVLRESLGIAGLGMIVVAATTFQGGMPFPGFAALLPCGGAALLILAGRSSPTFAGRLLSPRPVVFLGKISYSLYLWHWPAIAWVSYVRLDSPSNTLKGAAYLGALAAAIVSWKYVETPFRTRAWVVRRSRYFWIAGATIATLCGLGLAIREGDGYPVRLPSRVVKYAAGRTDYVPAYCEDLTLAQAQSGNFVPLGSTRPDAPVDFFVCGDSHAMSLFPALDALGRSHGVRGYAAAHGGIRPLMYHVPDSTDPDSAEEAAVGDAVVSFIKTHRIPNVVLIARWAYQRNERAPVTHQYLAALANTFAALHATGARIWVVNDVPQLPWRDLPRFLARTALGHGDFARFVVPATGYREQLAQELQQFSPLLAKGDRLLDPSPYLIRNGHLVLEHDGWPLFRDDNHLTIHGAKVLEPMLEPLFAH